MPSFLAWEDLLPIELPFHRSPHKVAVPREERASSRLSLKAEIDQFYFDEKGEKPKELVVRVSDSEDKLNKFSDVRTPGLVTARVDDNSKDKEEMALNRKKGMKEFLTERNKGISESPPLPAPPPSSSSYCQLAPHPQLEEEKEGEWDNQEGESGPPKEA